VKNYATHFMAARRCYAVLVLLAFVHSAPKVNAWTTNAYSGTNFFGVSWQGFGVNPYTWSGYTNADPLLYSSTNGDSQPLSPHMSNYFAKRYNWSTNFGIHVQFEPVPNYFMSTNFDPDPSATPGYSGYGIQRNVSWTLSGGDSGILTWRILTDSLGSNYVQTYDGYRNSQPAIWDLKIFPQPGQSWQVSVTNLTLTRTTQYIGVLFGGWVHNIQGPTFYLQPGDVSFYGCYYQSGATTFSDLPLVQFYQDDRGWNTLYNFPADTTQTYP
jgi:hypothetical protein